MSTTELSDFLADGYTQEATIAAEAGINGELTFTFRPALPEQFSKLLTAGSDDELYSKRAIDLLATLLVSWTLKTPDGAVVPITRENIARVRRPLLLKIIDKAIFTVNVGTALKNSDSASGSN